MFRERVSELLEMLGASNREIARYADCAPSTISRLRTGARKPNPQSPTINTFVDGVIHYANIHGYMKQLCELTGINDDRLLDSGIKKWLFIDDDDTCISATDNSNNKSMMSFSNKLNSVMTLADISNVWLARLVNVDTSYISRFRNGLRSPKSNPELLNRLCSVLFDQLDAKNLLPELAELINISSDSLYEDNGIIKKDELYIHFHTWLDDFHASDHDAINHLLNAIATFSPKVDIVIPPLSQIVPDYIINDNNNVYQGTHGIQNAVLRFLGGAARDKYDELLLYSDQSMAWMVDDETFHAKWAALMALCVKQGTHIKIIHNIDRDISEMVEAVESWMPLYVSGAIESYYNKKSNGNRFHHTIFMCPGKACIAACHTSDMDNTGIYHYYTDPMQLDFYQNNFEHLIKDSRQLAKIEHDEPSNTEISGSPQQESYNNLSLSITSSKVIIVKNSAPRLWLTFTHPLLCNAFLAYVEHARNNRDQ